MSSPHGALVIPCQDLDKAVETYSAAGFRLDALGPADDPSWAEMSMAGLQLVLTVSAERDRPYLRVRGRSTAAEPTAITTLPDLVELAETEPKMTVPAAVPELVVEHEIGDRWIRGRAGMLYRDLVPDRHGGAYIASHIQIPEGGPVPDYVHHHDIAFQMIFCHRGWVRVVYQDQGPPFVMQPGDLVLQPPGIRHRVLESSDNFFVVEITCPASHRTNLDHELELPNDSLEPHRSFGGQRFVRHIAAEARWEPRPGSPFEHQITGIAAATGGVASAEILRPATTPPSTTTAPSTTTQPSTTTPASATTPASTTAPASGGPGSATSPWPLDHSGDLRFLFVIEGTASVNGPDGLVADLQPGSSIAVPPGTGHTIDAVTADSRILDVACTVAPTPPEPH